MRKLIIDPRGGLSGDMFCAGLMSICRSSERKRILKAMAEAGQSLGECRIDYVLAEDGSARIKLDIVSRHHSISEDSAREIIFRLFDRFEVSDYYRDVGRDILDILIEAEKEAHSKYDFFKKGKINEILHVHHGHNHNNANSKTHLHEAQDIVIDIIGAVYGLQILNIENKISTLFPVAVGGGSIDFSHGLLFAPAPATSIILKRFNLPWERGPIEHELFTPTGASILAGLKTSLDNSLNTEDIVITGSSRGSMDYPVPPLMLYLTDTGDGSFCP